MLIRFLALLALTIPALAAERRTVTTPWAFAGDSREIHTFAPVVEHPVAAVRIRAVVHAHGAAWIENRDPAREREAWIGAHPWDPRGGFEVGLVLRVPGDAAALVYAVHAAPGASALLAPFDGEADGYGPSALRFEMRGALEIDVVVTDPALVAALASGRVELQRVGHLTAAWSGPVTVWGDARTGGRFGLEFLEAVP